MTEQMPCHITDGPQTPEDVDHGHRDEPEYDKDDDLTIREAAMQAHYDSIVMSNSELKALFVKYISHVGECEGVDFTEDKFRTRYKGFTEWSDEQWSQLQQLAARK